MKTRQGLGSRIRGWFPQEPKMSSRANQVRLPFKIKPLPKKVIIASFLAFQVVFWSVLFAFSTLQVAIVTSTAMIALFWFIFNRTHHNHASFFFKRIMVLLVVLVLMFNCFQFFVFRTSGYPTTSAPPLTYPAVINASLTQYLQDIEQSGNFLLIQLNHVNSATFERLELHSATNSGWLTWIFRTTDTNSQVTIGNTQNTPYYTNIGSLMESLSPKTQSLHDFTLQTATETFKQIDAVGIDTFLNHAIDTCQEPTVSSRISALNILIGYDDVGGYQGLTVTLSDRSLSQDSRGQTVYSGLFEAEFKPDGTLLSFKILG